MSEEKWSNSFQTKRVRLWKHPRMWKSISLSGLSGKLSKSLLKRSFLHPTFSNPLSVSLLRKHKRLFLDRVHTVVGKYRRLIDEKPDTVCIRWLYFHLSPQIFVSSLDCEILTTNPEPRKSSSPTTNSLSLWGHCLSVNLFDWSA